MTPLILALSLMTTAAPPPDQGEGEPLPPGAPTEPYELSAWCYGALGEYLAIYEKVKPDLRDIDKRFGTSVVEDEPYKSDMDAYRVELKMIGDSVTDAEKASDAPIANRGVAAMRKGRNIWSLAEAKTSRELARAWLEWALPDRCDSNAKELTQRSLLLGKALRYNADSAPPPATSDAPASNTVTDAFSTPLAAPPAQPAPVAADQAPPVANGPVATSPSAGGDGSSGP